jgi:hypothetical protein
MLINQVVIAILDIAMREVFVKKLLSAHQIKYYMEINVFAFQDMPLMIKMPVECVLKVLNQVLIKQFVSAHKTTFLFHLHSRVLHVLLILLRVLIN